MELLNETKASLSEADRAAFDTQTKELSDATSPHAKSHASAAPGSERAMTSLLKLLQDWIDVEKWFVQNKSYADAVESLRRAHKGDSSRVLAVCKSHAQLATTTRIVSHTISLISNGYRVGRLSEGSTSLGTRVPMLSGAESLSLSKACLQELAAMKDAELYSEVALQAQKELILRSMPSLEERLKRFGHAATELGDGQSSVELEQLLSEHLPLEDAIFPLLRSISSHESEVGFLELMARYLYRPYSIHGFQRDASKRSLCFTFKNQRHEHAISAAAKVPSVRDLKKIMSLSSFSSSDENDNDSDSGLFPMGDKEKIPSDCLRTGQFILIDNVDELKDPACLGAVLSGFPKDDELANDVPVNVLYIVVTGGVVAVDNGSVEKESLALEQALSAHVDALEQAQICRVTFVLDRKEDEIREAPAPALFTYRSPLFKEDELFRHVDPGQVFYLDLDRIDKNFHLSNVGSLHTSTCNVLLYEATPRSAAIAKDRKANTSPRIFARAMSYVLDLSPSSFERTLVDALDALDLMTLKSKSDNHLFINLISVTENVVRDPVIVEKVAVDVLKRLSSRISSLGIAEVETRVVCSLAKDSPPIAIRLVASNPTGYVLVVSTYVEAAGESGKGFVFKLIGGTKASVAGSSDSSWEGMSVDAPYPLTRPFDAQRRAALKATDTLYCYDIPALFEAAVEEQWTKAAEGRNTSGVSVREAVRPFMVTYTRELVVRKKPRSRDNTKNDGGTGSAEWTIQDYLDGNLELQKVNRGAGANDVGMVAWLMNLKTVEFPEVRVSC